MKSIPSIGRFAKNLALSLAVLSSAAVARATPYATSLTNNGVTLSFRLNESAGSVIVTYTNLSGTLLTTNLGAKGTGLITTNLAIPGSYSITVSKTNTPGYVTGAALQISVDATNTVKFNSPRGVAVNTDPASPYFGRIYVANSASGTAATRPVGDGIYLINADFSDAVGQGNTARNAGLNTFTNGDDIASSPWRLEVGQDGNLYISDFTPTNGTIYVVDPDVTIGTNVIAGLGVSGISPAASPNHGRISSSIIATGSLAGGNLTLFGLNNNVTNAPALTPNHIMQWNIGAGPLGQDLVVTNMDNDTLLPNSDITSDLDRGPDGKFYLLQNRSDGFEGGIFVVDPAVDGGVFYPTPDGLWDEVYDSRADSIGNFGESVDILRQSRGVKISPDGQYMAIMRDDSSTWIIPLINGLPNLAGRKLVPTGSTSIGRDVCFDAAGNLYIATSGHAVLRVFSPGYKTIATTTSTGTFSVTNILPDAYVDVVGVSTNAAEPSTDGLITFIRSGSVAAPLTVFYTNSGTAARGVDWMTNGITATSVGSITFAAGDSTTNIPITVIDDALGEATETVNFRLLPNTNYVFGSNSTITVFIADDGDLPTVSVASVGLGSYELLPDRPAKFTVSISAIYSADLNVNLSLGGTAVSGVDYTNSSTFSVALLQGTTSTNFTVTPIDNPAIAPNKTIIVSIVPSASYNIGTGSAANILRNDDLTPGASVFSDDFDTDTTANWKTNAVNVDNDATFSYDYSADGVPSAPHSAGGSTRGLRLRAHLGAISAATGISVSPIGQSFTGDFRLRFDLWMNYNGPMPGGGTGSSEFFTAGIGVSENRTNVTGIVASGGSGSAVIFSVDTDGGFAETTGDYIVYTNSSSITASGTNIYPAGARDNFNAYYAEFGELPAPAAQVALFPGPGAGANQTGRGQIGSLSFSWHDVVITKQGSSFAWDVDGLRIANAGYAATLIGSNFSLGYQDINTSLANNIRMNMALVDNLRVESLPDPQQPVITSVSIVSAGANIQIDFTGGVDDPTAAFVLQSATDVQDPYANVSATITSTGSGMFRAVRPVDGSQQFYRIKR